MLEIRSPVRSCRILLTLVNLTQPKTKSVNFKDKAMEIIQTETQEEKGVCRRVGNRTEHPAARGQYQIIQHVYNSNSRRRQEREEGRKRIRWDNGWEVSKSSIDEPDDQPSLKTSGKMVGNSSSLHELIVQVNWKSRWKFYDKYLLIHCVNETSIMLTSQHNRTSRGFCGEPENSLW